MLIAGCTGAPPAEVPVAREQTPLQAPVTSPQSVIPVLTLESAEADEAAILGEEKRAEPLAPSLNYSLVEANNAFGLDAYRHLAEENPGNIALSPASLSTVLAMTYAGAMGTTAEEMANVLHFADMAEPDSVHSNFEKTLKEWKALNSHGNVLRLANRVYAHKDTEFEKPYLDLMNARYGASAQLIDFDRPEAARKKMNNWVAAKTDWKIQGIFPSGVIQTNTRLVLVNAVYMKSKWENPFAKRKTRWMPFFTTPENKVSVPTMISTSFYKTAFLSNVSLVELPYKGEKLSMVLAIPTSVDGLPKIEKDLDLDALTEWSESLGSKRKIRIEIPRFKAKSKFSLASMFRALGMSVPFKNAADFSKMTQNEPLKIAAILHEAMVEVNESGTVAVAASGSVLIPLSRPIAPEVVRADHAFLYFIRDNRSGAILFVGRIANPAAS